MHFKITSVMSHASNLCFWLANHIESFFFPGVYGCFFWLRLRKIRYLFVGGFQVTDVNVAIVSPDFDLLKATSAMCFPRIQVAFRWSSPMAPPIVRLMGEPGVVLAADAFCYKKGRVGRVGHLGASFQVVERSEVGFQR